MSTRCASSSQNDQNPTRQQPGDAVPAEAALEHGYAGHQQHLLQQVRRHEAGPRPSVVSVSPSTASRDWTPAPLTQSASTNRLVADQRHRADPPERASDGRRVPSRDSFEGGERCHGTIVGAGLTEKPKNRSS
jgi:hypothetical protein